MQKEKKEKEEKGNGPRDWRRLCRCWWMWPELSLLLQFILIMQWRRDVWSESLLTVVVVLCCSVRCEGWRNKTTPLQIHVSWRGISFILFSYTTILFWWKKLVVLWSFVKLMKSNMGITIIQKQTASIKLSYAKKWALIFKIFPKRKFDRCLIWFNNKWQKEMRKK